MTLAPPTTTRQRSLLPVPAGATQYAYAYQLTPMGAPMPQLHVQKQLNWAMPHPCPTGSFSISGGKPQATVCWQLIRLS